MNEAELSDGLRRVAATLGQVSQAIDHCVANDLSLPALVLIYSTIDAMGALYDPDPGENRVKARFITWATRFLLPQSPRMQCTALELYAARCGLVHTLTADSSSSRAGTRKIVYAWGGANISALERATDLIGSRKWVAVDGAELARALQAGIAEMFALANRDCEAGDPELGARLIQKSEPFFAFLPAHWLDGL